MLVTIGDLVDDVVVRLSGPVNLATDTESVISRRRGGSAANVAVAAARLGVPSRFVGQVGDDAVGATLMGEMADAGVDVTRVRRQGSTGTIVVLVHTDGERTMLSDRRTCLDLAGPDPTWLDGATALHLPFYSLAGGTVGATCLAIADLAAASAVPVSVDLSSTALLEKLGPPEVADILRRVSPAVVFANEDEAPWLAALDQSTHTAEGVITVEKHGPLPAIVTAPGHEPVEVPALEVSPGTDTTGAGDAFAAGFVIAERAGTPLWSTDPVAATRAAHEAAAALLRNRTPHDESS